MTKALLIITTLLLSSICLGQEKDNFLNEYEYSKDSVLISISTFKMENGTKLLKQKLEFFENGLIKKVVSNTKTEIKKGRGNEYLSHVDYQYIEFNEEQYVKECVISLDFKTIVNLLLDEEKRKYKNRK